MRILLLFVSVFLFIPLCVAADDAINLKAMASKIHSLQDFEDPFRREKRWLLLNNDLATLEQRLKKEQRSYQETLEDKWQQWVDVRTEIQQYQEQLHALDLEKAPPADQATLVLEDCQTESARIELQLKQLIERRDRLQQQGYRQQLAQTQLLIDRLELAYRCSKDREAQVTAKPETSPLLAIEADLQAALNRLTRVEIGLSQAQRRTQRSENDMRRLHELQQDFWLERLYQVGAMLRDEHQPPFIQSVRYTQAGDRLCYASAWVDNDVLRQVDGEWATIAARTERLKAYRLRLLHEWRIARQEEYQALQAYHALEKKFPDRRLFELLTRIGLEATLPTFVASPGIGRNLLLQWRTLELSTQVQYDLRRLPGSLLRARTSPQIDVELFDLVPPNNQQRPPSRDPLVDYWTPLPRHELIAKLRPRLEEWARAEMFQVQRGQPLRQAYRIDEDFERFTQQYRRAAEGRIARIDLMRRVAPYRLDRFLMMELQQLSPAEFIDAATTEMRLILTGLRRALVDEKWRRLHHSFKTLAEQGAPYHLQQLQQKWSEARRLEIQLTNPEPCLQDVAGQLQLRFNRPVRLEGINIGGLALPLTENREQDLYELEVPAGVRLLPVFNLDVKARLKQRMLPTHQLDANPATRTLPMLRPDGRLQWENYETGP